MLFTLKDAKAFFGKDLGIELTRRCQRNLPFSYKKRRDDLGGYVEYSHYKLEDFIDFQKNFVHPPHSNTRNNIKTDEFFKKVMLLMNGFEAHLSTIEALKDS